MKTENRLTYAIIPSRSGSKRFKNKNIYQLLNYPLFYYSINFAKKLSFVDKVIFSTDSNKYIKIAKKYKNLIIHKRQKYSSVDNAMEEDVLNDLNKFIKKKKLKPPTNLLWLRPTNPLRCLKTFEKAYKIFNKYSDTVMVVHETDGRLFYEKKNFLKPIKKEFLKRSMVRGQDTTPFLKIFSGEFFKYQKKYKINFLGKKKRFIIAPKLTKLDIDSKSDILFLEYLIKKFPNKYKKFLHKKLWTY